MSKRVFLSYCREASSHSAQRLKAELRDLDVFLDSRAIEAGDDFSAKLLDALLQSHLVVMFAESRYFSSRWCLEEAHIAASALARSSGESGELPIVVALPDGASRDLVSELLARLPPALKLIDWPAAGDTAALAELVNRTAVRCDRTIAERLGDDALYLPAKLREKWRLPETVSTTATPYVPLKSLGDQFVGRSDAYFALHKMLYDKMVTDGRARAVAICGVGGVGKTQLASEYFRRSPIRDYPGGRFWINARGTEDELTTQFQEILDRLNGDDGARTDRFSQSRAQVRHALTRALSKLEPSDRVLYVVDDIPEELANAALTRWCPVPERVYLLISSRAKLTHNETLQIETLDLEELNEGDAISMLRSSGDLGLKEEDFRALVRWVGGLPLALDVLKKSLESEDSYPSTLRNVIKSSPAPALDNICDRLRALVPLRGPAAAYTVSWQSLSPGARKLAALIAQLSEAPIPVSLVLRLESEAACAPAKSELRLRSFITTCGHSKEVEFYGRMHRVLASFIREHTPPDALEAAQHAVLDVMTEAACKTPERWPEMEACLPHAERVAWSQIQRDTEVTPGPIEALYDRVWTLLNSEGRRDEDPFGPIKEGQRLVTLLGENDAFLTGCALMQLKFDRLGDLKLRLQDVELPVHHHVQRATDEAVRVGRQTAQLIQHVVALRRAVRRDAGSTVTAMNDLACLHCWLAEHDTALQFQEEIFEICYTKLGAGHPNTVVAAWNAWGTLSILRRPPKQGKIVAVLEAAVKNNSHPDPRVRQVGVRYTFLGLPNDDLATAELSFRRLMDPSELIAQLQPVAQRFAAHASGSADPTRAALDWLLLTCETYLGLDHPRTVETTNWLIDYLLAIGDFPSARAHQERVFEVCLRNLGITHRNTSVAAFNLLDNAMLRERNPEVVGRVFQEGLEWLLGEPDDHLHADQVTIRDAVIATLELAAQEDDDCS